MEQIKTMPEDIINHIGQYYITKQMKLQWRIHKLYKKVEELEKRSIDDWIEHLKFSKRYSIKKIEIMNDRIQFHTLWGDTCKCNQNELIHQGSIAHVRQLYLWYIQRIIRSSTPAPQYEGEKIVNIVGEQMIAKMIQYGYHENYRCLVFIRS
jgi:hypothetical protein